MQTKKELEEWYSKEDPWDYENTEDDHRRLNYILEATSRYETDRALDLGAGEGFITRYLVANDTHAIELSDKASSRLPRDVQRVKKPVGKYDLILACGILYEHYDYESMLDIIKKHASDVIITCHYDKIGVCHDKLDYKQVYYAEFPYRKGKQIMRVYRV